MFVKVTIIETNEVKFYNVNLISEINYEGEGSRIIVSGFHILVEETPEEINDQTKVSFKD